MIEKRNPIPVSDAIQRVINHVQPLPIKKIELEKASGCILREPIIATHAVPPFNRSAYDGYAIRAEDSTGASPHHPIAFHVVGEIGAGQVPEVPIGKNEAYRIMTGAILPEQADAIVMLEKTTKTNDGFTVLESLQPGDHVSFKGEDAKKGEVLIEPGTKIHPGTIALLATFGYANVNVSEKPIAGVLATGTELLDVTESLQPGKIRNSNGPMIQAQLDRLGISCRSYGMLPDDLDACMEVMEQALQETDVVITTGGVSVGDYDYLPALYKRLGAKVLFDKVMMRPGSVTTVAALGDKLLFGLSGNPSACFTGFELFARPAIMTMMGSKEPYLAHIHATLGEDFTKNNPFTRFIRGIWKMTKQGVIAIPAGFNKSNAVSSIARGNCLIVLPSGSSGYRKGMQVDILLLGVDQGEEKWRL
ncbi:molybdopterin molybdotransferase MoeA [Virgibacillus pantothenticus]|uniref:Molybdopterin molybdenumtransferase n=1 Tax=Virgibacillus pantothenticus TaxID=1473 RepID=A0A0L0QQ39_VIRPA|nr:MULTISPECIES: gephyrin-like molybdotransferase Glp [Virgibacillus]API90716.1 molybdopterin molybdenumtransferase [Virgibacillus sp. 6R]KNE20666.1 molybdopterin molybdenumtransferase [Virgibacillus pantothenticus]MBS7427684.1 molybdopterin molybdotransferase MoeA [Virgibacillus sp. 19R1-5]MBU8566172.1 molybdopterin molybdotransferase MoeA [Virgibacillus pantothenticus]MBU8600532.1 molybdopterin molybdotransferase MoeA [Virgibacillus pantothenticus]